MSRSPGEPGNPQADVVDRIRRIFLHAGAQVTIADAVRLLASSRRQMKQAIASGEVAVTGTPPRSTIRREELIAKALEVWPLDAIEDALGADADGILPPVLRTAELCVRLPRHQIAMLEYRARQHRTTVSGILSRQLDDAASADAEELSAAIPGFAAALEWPEV